MKELFIATGILLMIAACASTQQQTNQMAQIEYQPSKVYVDSVKKVNQNGQAALKIFGKYPDACTHLEGITHQIKNGEIHLQFNALREKGMMCAQVLVPFSVVYDKLSDEEIASHSKVIIKETAYNY